jgi:hypothetical protein
MGRITRIRSAVARLVEPHAGKWVAISSKKEVVGISHDIKGAVRQAQEHGEEFPLIVRSPDANTAAFLY